MSYKTYTVNVDGKSEGNVISAPFTIEIHRLDYTKSGGVELLTVESCTKNGSANPCKNDDVDSVISFPTPDLDSSKNLDLQNNFAPLLDAAYGAGNWS